MSEQEARMFNLGRVGEHTQFIIDAGASEYNQITLKLSPGAQNFIAKVRLWGADEFAGTAKWTDLGTHTIYDFSREKLGSSHTVSLPDSRFKFLRVRIDGLTPENIKGVTVATTLDHEAQWTELRAATALQNRGRETGVTLDVGDKTPVEKIVFTVPKAEKNFYRTLNVSCLDPENHESYASSDAVSRVYLTRDGNTVDSEHMAVSLPDTRASRFRLSVDNGDDPPLKIEKVSAMQVQRRIYFDPKGANKLTLYYGDPKLNAPVYDYAKLFQEQRDAARAEVGPGMHNAAYTGRPDERPWTERHGWILWAALVAVVLGLGAVALKSFKRA
jgi:hypothetical protein